MEERRDIVYIGIDHIHTHPENPRKDLGDLTELAESMKKQGCLQNLTVVPVEEQPGEYYALIGNRRHGASKLAGLEELPCRIAEGLSRKEQLSIMLEENMQRSDLTIYEQAQGFQLMLDLGDTEEQIAEKTGFSKTTIRRRLNIAKLNQDELKKKEQDENFQLTLKDLYELEKVKDIKTRDKILREATSSRDLVSRAQAAAAEAMMALGSYIYASTVRDFYLKKSYYESSPEEKKAADESAGKLSSLHQMMIILHNSMKICNEPYDYNLVFNKNKGDALLKGYEVFEPYGWYFEDEKERQVLDGTSELYRKEKKE